MFAKKHKLLIILLAVLVVGVFFPRAPAGDSNPSTFDHSSPPKPAIPADNPLEISIIMTPNSYTTEYLARFLVGNAPSNYYLGLTADAPGVIGYMLTEAQYEDWYSSRPALPTSYIQSGSFDLDVSIDFHLRFFYNGTYYIVAYNRADYSVSFTGEWSVDVWAPEITHNLQNGQVVKGMHQISANVSDVWPSVESSSVKYVALSIDDILVCNETNGNLTYGWDTTLCLEGKHTFKLASEDNSGNVAVVNIEVTIDNVPDPTPIGTADGEAPSVNPEFLLFLLCFFGVPVAGVVIAAVAWGRYQSRRIEQSPTSDTKKRKKRKR